VITFTFGADHPQLSIVRIVAHVEGGNEKRCAEYAVTSSVPLFALLWQGISV
jgi:hypothetical protein